MREAFARFARRTAFITGSPTAFILALAVIIVWAVTGPMFHFSDTWQLVINTGTTIVTFLMVFLIQNSQNRESLATQIKLDELIRAVERANNGIINIEERSEQDLERLQQKFRHQADKAAERGDLDEAEAEEEVAEDIEAAKENRPVQAGR